MKLNETIRNIESTGVLSEGAFGISANDQAHVLTILRDKLYSDKFLAIVREYTTNAWDAHIEAGCPERPIKVTVPTRWDATLSIRDFGNGLTRDQVYRVYTQYGASTKRSSNSVVGQLGLGCKAGFSYSNTFTIVSYCQGLKTTYVAYIDETNVGKINEMQSVPSDETGVEIQIAIRANDVDIIKERVQKMFPYFSPAPECNVTIPALEYILEGLPEEKVLPSGRAITVPSCWKIRKTYGNGPIAVMGNIPYPIEKASLPDLKAEARELLENGIDIHFEIGELSVSASRESLEYTDVTRQSLYRKLHKIRNEILSTLKVQFDACQNVWEARNLYRDTQKASGPLGRNNIVARLASSSFRTWQGHNLQMSDFDFKKNLPAGLEVRYLASTAKRATDDKTPQWRTKAPFLHLTIMKNDVTNSWLKRVLEWRQTNSVALNQAYSILIIDDTDPNSSVSFDARIEEYCKLNELTGITIHKISDTILPPRQTRVKGTAPVNTKAKAKAFSVIQKYECNKYPASTNWEPCEIDLENGSGPYIILFNFLPQTETQEQNKYLNLLFHIGLDTTVTPIIGIRPEMKDKLGSGWIEFLPWAAVKAKELIANFDKRDELVSFYLHTQYPQYSTSKDRALQETFFTKVEDKNIAEVADILKEANKLANSFAWDVKNRYKTILETMSTDIIEQASEISRTVATVETAYPLLKDLEIFCNGTSYLKSTAWPDSLAQYVNTIYNNGK